MAKITLKNNEVLNLSSAIQAISAVKPLPVNDPAVRPNPRSGVPVFDIGFKASYALARTLAKLKPDLEALQSALDSAQKRSEEAKESFKAEQERVVDGESEADKEVRIKNAESAMNETTKEAQKDWEDLLKATVEVEIHQFPLSEIKQPANATTIPPTLLADIDCLIIDDSANTNQKK